MINLIFLIGALPVRAFAQGAGYTLSPLGVGFMALAWGGIMIWNLLCFRKILKHK